MRDDETLSLVYPGDLDPSFGTGSVWRRRGHASIDVGSIALQLIEFLKTSKGAWLQRVRRSCPPCKHINSCPGFSLAFISPPPSIHTYITKHVRCVVPSALKSYSGLAALLRNFSAR